MHEIKLRYFDWHRFRNEHTMSWTVRPSGVAFNDTNDLCGRSIADVGIGMSNYVHSDPLNPLGQRVISETGAPPVEAAARVVGRESTKNVDFKKRCAQGEIIVAPYKTFFGTAVGETVYNTVSDVQVSGGTGARFNTDLIWNSLNFWNGHEPFPFQHRTHNHELGGNVSTIFYNIDGTWSSMMATGVGLAEREKIIRSSGSFSELTGIDLQALLNLIKERSFDYDIKGDLVQDVAVKANSGDLDVLTSIAELPDTVQSILDGFQLIEKIFADWKKKMFKLHSQADNLSKVLAKRKYRELIAKKRKGFPPYQRWKSRKLRANEDASIERWRHERETYIDNLFTFEQYWSRKEAYFRRRAKHELADAVAGVHLNARYNIATNVYMLQDIGEVILNWATEYKRYRDKRVESNFIDFEELIEGQCVFVGDNQRTHRAFIKRQYDVSNSLEKLGRSLTADVLVTGYEMVKLWSIIFDWFFTIGDCIRAINWNPNYKQQASCYSVKTEVHGILSLTRTVNGEQITCKCRIDYDGYHRNLITPGAWLGIYWRPKFDLIRQLDALAFFWSSNRQTLKTYYAR